MNEEVLINETEFVKQFCKEIQEKNKDLSKYFEDKYKEVGINTQSYAGGLMTIPCHEEMSLESLLNNIIAIFSNNYLESVFFQTNNVKQLKTLAYVQSYLTANNLLNDFLRWRGSN